MWGGAGAMEGLLLGIAFRVRGLRLGVELHRDDEFHDPGCPVRLERFAGAWTDSLRTGAGREDDDLEEDEDLEDGERRVRWNPPELGLLPPAPPFQLVPGVRATSAEERLRLADLAGEHSACWYQSLRGPFPVPPPVPDPVGDGGAPLELAHWAVVVGRDLQPRLAVHDEWAGPSGAADVVDPAPGAAGWRGFATETEAFTYLRAFARRLDYLDVNLVDRVAELAAELGAPAHRPALNQAGRVDEQLTAALEARRWVQEARRWAGMIPSEAEMDALNSEVGK